MFNGQGNFSTQLQKTRPKYFIFSQTDKKISGLPKLIQKIDPNARMPKIFMDSFEKSVFIYVCFHVINLTFISVN